MGNNPEIEQDKKHDDSVPGSGALKNPGGSGNSKRKRAGLILLIVCATGAVLGLKWWISSKTHLTTDNAFVETTVHSLAARIPGRVSAVLVKDNQFVHKGDLLVELDPNDYEAKAREAEANVAMARNETSGDYAQVAQAEATVSHGRARLDQARIDLRRGVALFSKEVIPKEQLDRLTTAERIATSQLREAEESLRRARAVIGLTGNGGKEARVAEKQALLDEAKLKLSYTKIFAPADGYVTKKAVETGNYIQPGQPLMAVVQLQDSWIVANYKEKQLTHVQPGQKVEFEVDTYPGQKFKGTVDSIMAGTGAAFSLLPPENATGNYVKVVQRIPVKITIDGASDPKHQLRVGMSVVPTILVKRKVGDIIKEMLPF